MLQLNRITLRRGNRTLIQDASLIIHAGNKVGITGRNGTGKSSLFALILGQLHADGGEISLPPKLVVAHVAQETPAVDTPAIDYALEGDKEFTQLYRELAQAQSSGDGAREAAVHLQLDAIDGYTARARAGKLLRGLGFEPGQENQPARAFSGGWRMRLNLAQALICRSDVLLLDEPTNHLDLDAVVWLQDWLRAYKGTLLLISHDREFLDDVTDHIAHLERESMTLYTGNYSAFERARAQQLATQQSAYEKQQREVAHIRSFIDRFRAQATKAKQAQSRIKALERIELIAAAHIDSPFHFALREPAKLPNPLLNMRDVRVGYTDSALLGPLKLSLHPGQRIGLLGPNGAGKSTFIKLLAGALPTLSGEVVRSPDLRIGYFAQHQLEQLNSDDTPLGHLRVIDKVTLEQELRDFLGGFAFSGEMASAKVGRFSGGEKARLVLALLVYQKPNLLLLDEPTNHLDLEMRDALTVALQDFSGCVVLVSHDRYLLRSVADTLMLVADSQVKEFDGDLDDYRLWSNERRSRNDVALVSNGSGEHTAASRKEQRKEDAERRRQLQPLRNEISKLEKNLAALTDEKKQVELRLADPTLYTDKAKEDLKTTLARQQDINKKLAVIENSWMEAAERLESAQALGD